MSDIGLPTTYVILSNHVPERTPPMMKIGGAGNTPSPVRGAPPAPPIFRRTMLGMMLRSGYSKHRRCTRSILEQKIMWVYAVRNPQSWKNSDATAAILRYNSHIWNEITARSEIKQQSAYLRTYAIWLSSFVLRRCVGPI